MKINSNKINPPRGAIRFIEWQLGNSAEDLIGDLEELFARDITNRKVWIAQILFWYRAVYFSISKTGRVRKKFNFGKNRYSNTSVNLFGSYLKVAVRNVLRSKLFSIINVAGLALGMSAGLLVISMTNDLLKFDEFHENKDYLHRVVTNAAYYNYGWSERATTCEPVASVLKQTGGVKNVVRIQKRLSGEVDSGAKILPLSGYFADEDFFEIFSFDFIRGGAENSLTRPFQIVLTENTAIKLFNNLNVMDSTLKVGNLGYFTITGIVKDVPKASHMQFEMVASFSTVPILERDKILSAKESDWTDVNGTYVYCLLEPDASIETIENTLNREASEIYANFDNVKAAFSLQNLKSIVPGKDLSNSLGPKMIDIAIYIMSGLAFMILLSATFNYAHLSSARLLQKSREIGLRKVIGGTRKQLFIQFISETLVVSFISLILSIGIFILIRPHFLAIVPRASEMLDLEITSELFLYFLLFALLAGILAGTLPALYFSRLNPVQALRKVNRAGKKFTSKKSLVVAQFTLSIIFILGVFIISKQYTFSLQYGLGFKPDSTIVMPIYGINPEIVKGEIQKLNEVESIAMGSLIPGTGSTQFSWIKNSEAADSLSSFYMSVDEKFVPALDVKLLAGRNFHPEMLEPHSILINEHLARMLGFDNYQNALEKLVRIQGKEYRIIGVVNDFHYTHLEEPIRNFYLVSNHEQFYYAFVKVNSANITQTFGALENAWLKFAPKKDFNARFMEEHLQRAYSHYVNIMKIFGFLGTLAITIACLGLLGIAVYSMQLRVKEVGIRKVMGATELGLVGLLSRNFLAMMAIAICIGVPIAYFFFNLVLLPLNYYHTKVGVLEIFYSIVLMTGLGLLMIGSQTLKAATSNPAEVLRNE